MVDFAIYTTSRDVVYDSLKIPELVDMVSTMDLRNVIIAIKKESAGILVGLRTSGKFEGEPRTERLVLFLRVNSVDEYSTALKEISEFMRTETDRKVFLELPMESVNLSLFDVCRAEIKNYAPFIAEVVKRERNIKVRLPECLMKELEKIPSEELDTYRIKLSLIGLYVLSPLIEYTPEWIFFSMSPSKEPGIWFTPKGDELRSFKVRFAVYAPKGDSEEKLLDQYNIRRNLSDVKLSELTKKKAVLYLKKIEEDHYIVVSIFKGSDKFRKIAVLIEFPTVMPMLDSIDVEFKDAVEEALTSANISIPLEESITEEMETSISRILGVLMETRKSKRRTIAVGKNIAQDRILNNVAFKATLLKNIVHLAKMGTVFYKNIFIGLGKDCPPLPPRSVCIILSKSSRVHVPVTSPSYEEAPKKKGFSWSALFGGLLIGLIIGMIIASMFAIPLPLVKKTPSTSQLNYTVRQELVKKVQFLANTSDKNLVGASRQFNKALLALNGTISSNNLTAFLNYTVNLLILYDKEYQRYKENYEEAVDNITRLNKQRNDVNNTLRSEIDQLRKELTTLKQTNDELNNELNELKTVFGPLIEKNLTAEIKDLNATVTTIAEYSGTRKASLEHLLNAYNEIEKKAISNSSLAVKYQAIIDRMNITVFENLYRQANSTHDKAVKVEKKLLEISKLINNGDYVKAKKMLDDVKEDVKDLKTQYETFKQSFDMIVRAGGDFGFKKWAPKKGGDTLFKVIYETVEDTTLSSVFLQLDNSYDKTVLRVNGKQVDPVELLEYLIRALNTIVGG